MQNLPGSEVEWNGLKVIGHFTVKLAELIFTDELRSEARGPLLKVVIILDAYVEQEMAVSESMSNGCIIIYNGAIPSLRERFSEYDKSAEILFSDFSPGKNGCSIDSKSRKFRLQWAGKNWEEEFPKHF